MHQLETLVDSFLRGIRATDGLERSRIFFVIERNTGIVAGWMEAHIARNHHNVFCTREHPESVGWFTGAHNREHMANALYQRFDAGAVRYSAAFGSHCSLGMEDATDTAAGRSHAQRRVWEQQLRQMRRVSPLTKNPLVVRRGTVTGKVGSRGEVSGKLHDDYVLAAMVLDFHYRMYVRGAMPDFPYDMFPVPRD